MEYSKVAGRLREQIGQFSGELSKGLPKVSKRLVSELVYGIQASQSVVLTKVGRVLEENIFDQEDRGTACTSVGA